MPWIMEIVVGSFIAGILFATMVIIPVSVWYGGCLLFLAFSAWLVKTHPQAALWGVAALFLTLGGLRYNHAVMPDPQDISRYAGQIGTVRGSIGTLLETLPGDAGFKAQFVLAAASLELPGRPAMPVSGGIRVTALCNKPPVLVIGQQVAVKGKVLQPHGYNNPGQADFAASLERQGITTRITAQPGQLKLGSAPAERSWQQDIFDWRQTIRRRIAKVMPPAAAAILFGMLFGGYAGIDPATVRDFAATGIVHILSVSGTHIALAAGVIIWLGTRLHWRYRHTSALAGVSIIFYSLLAGFTPPVLRSAVMGLVALTAACWGREKDVAVALMLAGLGMLVYEPRLVYDLSFQLSFGATCGLVYLYPRLVTHLSRLPGWLASALAVTLAAQLGVLPFIAWYFNTFPVSSFIANIIIVPVVEVIVILGLAGSLLGVVWELPGNIILVGCALLIGVVEEMTGWLADWGGTLYLPSPSFGLGVFYYLIVLYLLDYRPANWPAASSLLQRYPRCAAGIFVLISIGCLVNWWLPRPVAVHFIDVGQGDAALVVTPHKRAVLIDTGGLAGDAAFDVGERVVLPYLRHYGVRRLDMLILTHGHQDHAGGAAAIVRTMPVGAMMIAREPASPAVQSAIRGYSGEVISTYHNQQFALDDVSLAIVHAAGDAANVSTNETSSVVRVSYGRHSFLLTGDLTISGERDLLRQGQAACTVLKVAHHGARTSTSQQFLQAAAPKYAIISVGTNNRFGHPHVEVLMRLQSLGTTIYRTDQNGAVIFATDGTNLTVTPFIEVIK